MAMTLSSLVRDEASVAEDVLANILSPLLEITTGGEIMPTGRFIELSRRGKVLAVLTALKAMRILKIRSDESAGPTEISSLGGIALGSVKPEVRTLEKENVIVTKKGRYHIPLRSINFVANYLSEEISHGH